MRLVWLLLPLLACVRTPPAPPLALDSEERMAPPAAPAPASPCAHGGLLPDALLAEGSITVLGEVHGTEESPQAVGDVACQGLLLGRAVVLVLEIPDEETARLEAFLAGGSQEALLEGPFWRRDYQDGRSSLAVVRLLERARRMRASGLPLSVLAMDVNQTGVDRDTHMARRVLAARAAAPRSAFVVLVGNLHARPRLSLPRSMAWRVTQGGAPLTALVLTHGEGSTWLCDIGGRDSCGVHPLRGGDRGLGPVFTPLDRTSASGFDGELYLGPPHASPPAVSASRPASSATPAGPPRP